MNILKIAIFRTCLYCSLCCSVFFSTAATAFSPAPETSEDYQPANWQSSLSANEDALKAIENKDLRLLSFAGKSQSIPGINNEHTKNARDKCGVRYFEEFGDVIRERNDIERRKKAKVYAIEYNQTVMNSCSLPHLN